MILVMCTALLIGLTLAVTASATPSGWKPNGGVTDPTDYADYSSAIVGNEYQQDIEAATKLGLIVGHDDRTYRPDDNVTVGQFANIIARNYWQQGAADEDNLAYLGALGIDVSEPSAALTLDQLRAIADAVEGEPGVADLAVLQQVRDGSLIPAGTGGGITRGQAVDLLAHNSGGSSANGYSSKPEPPPPPPRPPEPPRPPKPPREDPTLTAAIAPNPAKRQQMVTITATVTYVQSASAQLPWQSINLTGSGATRTASTCIPADLVDGTYPVRVQAIGNNGQMLYYDLQLIVRGSIFDDYSFIITD